MLAVLHEPRFEDLGRYLCSERTMYRVLAENQEVRERRANRKSWRATSSDFR